MASRRRRSSSARRASSRFAILPHPQAPLFDSETDIDGFLADLGKELRSQNFHSTEKILDLIRQAGLVSLFFFERYILSASGPYDLLNEDLHLQMCNFRQSEACMQPGARAAIIVPRGFYKSTTCGHGSDTWELTRNSNLCIRVISNIAERAEDFKRTVQRNIDSNPLYRELWPQKVPSKSAPRWNENEMCMPDRTRNYTEASLSAGGVTGAQEGLHFDLLDLDDIEGLDDLDAERRSNINMYRKKTWFQTSATALLRDSKSRIILKGTLYSPDDVYSDVVLKSVRKVLGYKPDFVKTRPDGTWTLYYRCWKEDGKVVFPEVMDEKRYGELLASPEGRWVALTQYANRPYSQESTEFRSMTLNRTQLRWNQNTPEWLLRGDRRLLDCSRCIAWDPAGTESNPTSRHSRAAIGAVAEDWEENVYLLWNRTGFFSIMDQFDMVFEACAKFGITDVVVESNAMQRIIAPLLQRESVMRNYYIHPVPIAAVGDKVGRIRFSVGRVLQAGRLWVCEGASEALEEEITMFPQNQARMDTLDMLEKAITFLKRPLPPEDAIYEDIAEEEYRNAVGRSPVTGY